MNNSKFPLATDRSNYWALSTDYVNYAFVVSCFDLADGRSSESYWLLGRTYPLPQASRDRADALIRAHLDPAFIDPTTQGIEQ